MKKIKHKVCSIQLPPLRGGLGWGFWLVCWLSPLLWRGAGGEVFAQQIPFSSQYYTNPFVINPAFTGTTENINAFLTHRSQWTGVNGAPQTSYLTLDGPAQAKNIGLGLKVYSDVTDMISRTGAFANYSYKLKINDDNTVLFGLALGVLNNKIDFSKAVIRDTDDPMLFQTPQNRTVFSADFGVLYLWKKLTVGFAIPQVLGNKIKYTLLDGDNSYYNLSRHYQGSVKYVFDVVPEKGITAYPLIMLRAVKGAPVQYDINAVVDWKKIGWAGITYHSTYAVAISAGVRYKNFSVGYAYDMGVSKIRSYTGRTSEFLLGYTFGETKKGFVTTEEPITDTLIAQLKAIADTNRIEINRLKAELAKTQTTVTTSSLNADSLKRTATAGSNDVLLAQMKTISDRYYEVVNQVDEALLAQMKVVSDSNQAQIDRLKAEIAEIKAIKTAAPEATKTSLVIEPAKILPAVEPVKTSEVIEARKTIDNLLHSITSGTEKEAVPAKPTEKTVVGSGGVVRTSESDDFAEANGKPVSKGFYVVIGTFGNKENVDKFKAANIIKGHVNTKIIQNHFTKVYRVYVLKANNKADAEAERDKYKKEYPDVWILILE